jgi:hypothetical protein
MSNRSTNATLPKSPTGSLTGLAGLTAGVLSMHLLHDWPEATYLKTMLIMVAAAAAMILVEMLVYKPYRNASAGLASAPVNPLDLQRIAKKLLVFWMTIAVLACLYLLLPEYAGEFYAPFRNAFQLSLPLLAVLSPVYVVFVDRRQLDPEDSYVQVANFFLGRREVDWAVVKNYSLGWLVKGFFLPLMFVFLNGNVENTTVLATFPDLTSFSTLYEQTYVLLFMFDVLLAAIGYVFTLRVLDAHIRSAMPDLLGWAVCLACYPPFWSVIGSNYLAYERDDAYWGHFFEQMPVLYVIWGCVILALVGVYVSATVAFGMRFSNLTHRGIITNGPYRWLKHPAYVSKNLTWWMISVPFLTTMHWTLALQSCVLLAGVNALYFMRARTEERLLLQDPVYRQYAAYIREHGLVAMLRRLAGLAPPPAAAVPDHSAG